MSALEVKDLRARGRGGLALGPVDVALPVGRALALVGGPGAGKSLFLSALAGLVPSTSQALTIPGAVGMIFQRDALDDGRSALDNVALAAAARGKDDPRGRARRALEGVGLGEHVDKLPRSLSGGMKKRVGIARALVVEPALLLADDPTAGLDPDTAREILALFVEGEQATKRCLVIATQDVDVVLPRVHEVLALDDGQVAWRGPPAGLEGAWSPFAPRTHAEGAWA
jgi:phospholipid/cholesterol/gamma-HCH transport system ATP-binding protein